MSPLLDLQRQLRRLGKLRMGRVVEATNAKGEAYTRPAKLDTWRVTSPSREIIDGIAEVYGGTVEAWASPDGDQWEVLTDAATVDVIVPPGDNALTQWNELWSGGGCQRRCDGYTETLTGKACLCPADADQRRELAQKGKACKPTSRLIVIVPAAPDLGAFMVESHGYYAAVELAGTFEILRMAAPRGALLRARLRIDQRHRIVDGKTTRWAVPVLETPGLSLGNLSTGGGALSLIEGAQGSTPPPPVVYEISPGAFMEVTRNDAPPLPPPDLPPPATRPPIDATSTVRIGESLKAGDAARETNARVAALDDEHVEILAAVLNARGLSLDDEKANDVIAIVTKQQTDAHLKRQRKANAAMAAMGVTTDDARHQFMLDATGGATSSSGHLTQEQCDAIVKAAT